VGLQQVALERKGNMSQQSGKSVLTFFAEQAKMGAQSSFVTVNRQCLTLPGAI
jgi:hypothetical protein